MTRWQAIWSARWYVLSAAVIAGVAVFAVSHLIPKRFSASAIVRVTLPSGAALSEQSVQASNDLASQYTQVATAAPILSRAAAKLGPTAASLSSDVTASTVAGENLVQISARGTSAGESEARANAVARAFVAYLNEENTKSSASAGAHLRTVQRQLQKVETNIENLQASREHGETLSKTKRLRLTTLQNEASSLQALEQSLFQAQVNSQAPNLSVFSPAGPGSQTQPQPKLYALVAFLVALLLASQAAVFLGAGERKV